MVNVLVYAFSGPGSSSGQGHGVVFFDRTLDSHSASIHPSVNGTSKFNAEE